MPGSDQFIGEVRIFPYQSVPAGWLPCEGQLLSTRDPKYVTLYSQIGAAFGGDGASTFGLPDFRARVPMGTGAGPNRTLRGVGDKGGEEYHTLIQIEMPSHRHTLAAQGVAANASGPRGNTFARSIGANVYGPSVSPVGMYQQAIGMTGGNQPHYNMQPYLTLCFCIAYDGTYPAPP
jgi:microcystin-dependent protein